MPKQELPLLADCLPAPLAHTPLAAEEAAHLARSFKAVADPVRLRLLSLIAAHEGGEACVCDLSDTFEVSGPTISHHLKVLREAGLISGERRGTWIYYRIRPATVRALSSALDAVQPELASAAAGPSEETA